MGLFKLGWLANVPAYEYFVMKTSFGNSANDPIVSFKSDFLRAGTSGTTAMVVGKFSRAGYSLWGKKYSYGTQYDYVKGIATADGGILIGGMFTSAGLIKINGSGTVDFSTKLSTGTTTPVTGISELSSGKFVLLVKPGGTRDTLVSVFSSTGTLLSQRHITEFYQNGSNHNQTILEDSSGNLILTGMSYIGGALAGKTIVKLDTSLNLVWRVLQQTFVPKDNDLLNSSVFTPDQSSFYVGGALQTNSNYGVGQIIKISSSTGFKSWAINVGNTPDTEGCTVIGLDVDSSGNLYVMAGQSTWVSATASNFVHLIKLDSDGNVIWKRKLTPSGTMSQANLRPWKLKVSGNKIMVSTEKYDIVLPTDGSKTGTHGDVIYDTNTVYVSAPTIVVTSVTETNTMGSNTATQSSGPTATVTDNPFTPTTTYFF